MFIKNREILIGHANSFHDPAIAILDGEDLFAESIERHMQCKRALASQGLWYSSEPVIEHLANTDRFPIRKGHVKFLSTWDRTQVGELLDKFNINLNDRLKFDGQTLNQASELHQLGINLMAEPEFQQQIMRTICGATMGLHPLAKQFTKRISWESKEVDHYLAHAATAVYTSPFEECVVVVNDGAGETSSMAVYHYANNEFKLLSKNDWTTDHSLGMIYGIATELCGFNPWFGEQWKVMGLAAYGKFDEKLYAELKKSAHIEDLRICADHERIIAKLSDFARGKRRDNGANLARSADLAFNFQKFFTDCVIELIRAVGGLGLSKNLAMSGGCALNSACNGLVLSNTNFRRLHVPCAPADDGNCLGAVLYEKYRNSKQQRELAIMSPYLGSSVDLKKLEKILSLSGIHFEKIDDRQALCDKVSKHLEEGHVIGWMQGRAEFGPRALGNRSILADPRPKDMKDRINSTLKFREFFRPFAPAILHEAGEEYFEEYAESPYMERTLVFREEVRDRVPAVVHQDGTGRLQTVKEEWNPKFHQLLHTFNNNTGIPVLLNTSFNVMGKPIIHRVEDAIAVFFTSGMSYLVIENYLLRSQTQPVE